MEGMCTVEKRGNLYILTLTGNNEHRLNPTRITAIRSALDQIKSESFKSKTSAALITTAHGKFFSNGYDLAWVNSSANPKKSAKTMEAQFKSLISDLISLPMPTIAAVTGHASAAGMILAAAHDYIVMRRDRGFLYMSEVDIGLVIPSWFMAVMRCKIGGGWEGLRRVVLAAEKVTGEKAKREMGLVHEVFDGVEGTVEGAVKVGMEVVKRGWDGGVYSENRKVVFKEVLDLIFGGDESGEETSERTAVVKSRL